MNTLDAPNFSSVSWGIVVPSSGTVIMFFLAASDALANRLRHLARLAHPETDSALAVADHDQAAEAEPPAALDTLETRLI
jgi:hypothetical protein